MVVMLTTVSPGMGVEKDYEKAVALLQDGCDKGHHQSCHNLAVMYYHGNGVEKNMDKFKHYNRQSKIFRGQVDPFKGQKPEKDPMANKPVGAL